MTEAHIDIHIPATKVPQPDEIFVDPQLNNWGRATLARELMDAGASVTFSRSKDAYDFETGEARVLTPVALTESQEGPGYDIAVRPERTAIEGIQAIRNVTGPLRHGVPELNHPDLRAITADKINTNGLLATLGLAKEYAVVGPEDDPEAIIDSLHSREVVAKPRRGKQGMGVVMGTKQEVAAALKGAGPEITDMVIEERLAMKMPMPVRGINEVEQIKIEVANTNQMAKELRAYYFGKDGTGTPQIHYVLRVAKEGMHHLHGDSWVFVDQDSVPSELFDLTAKVADGFRKQSDNDEIHLGIDWVRAQAEDGSPYWIPMEVNGGEPQLVYETENRDVAREHARLLASQLLRVAQKGGTQYTKEA